MRDAGQACRNLIPLWVSRTGKPEKRQTGTVFALLILYLQSFVSAKFCICKVFLFATFALQNCCVKTVC